MKRPILGLLAAATLSFGLFGSAPAFAHDGDDHSRNGHETRQHKRYHTPYHGDDHDDHGDHGGGHGRRRKQCEGLIAICLL